MVLVYNLYMQIPFMITVKVPIQYIQTYRYYLLLLIIHSNLFLYAELLGHLKLHNIYTIFT